MENEMRGSAKLIERMRGKPFKISQRQLDQLIGLSELDGVEILDWCEYGQPAIDGVCGRFKVRDAALALKVIAELLEKIELRPEIDTFPHGIVDPQFWTVSFRSGTANRTR